MLAGWLEAVARRMKLHGPDEKLVVMEICLKFAIGKRTIVSCFSKDV